MPAGAYRPRHARRWSPVTVTLAVLAVPVMVLAVFTAWHAVTYNPPCTHWVNPEHLGWPHSTCQMQTRPAPAWWTQKGSP